MTKLVLIHSPYAVECYDDEGEFLGSISRDRMEARDNAPLRITEALAPIFRLLGHAVQVKEEARPTFSERYTRAKVRE